MNTRMLVCTTLLSSLACICSLNGIIPSAIAQESRGRSAVKVNAVDGLKYVRIEPGEFQMGCSPGDTECNAKEKPPHAVKLTKPFWIGQTEVTISAYKKFIAATGARTPPIVLATVTATLIPEWEREQRPVVDITWNEAVSYCAWIGGRLPAAALASIQP